MNVEDTLSHIDATLDGADYGFQMSVDAMRWTPDPPAAPPRPAPAYWRSFDPDDEEAIAYWRVPGGADQFTIVHLAFDPWRAVSHPIDVTCPHCPVPDEVWAEVRAMPPLSVMFNAERQRLTTRSNPT